MASSHHTSSQNFKIEEFKEKMHSLGEVEYFLVDELPEENKLTKMFHIRERFKAVLDKIDKVEEESRRRESMYHLINVLTQWKDIKIRHRSYTVERISIEYHLKLTLKKMLEDFEAFDKAAKEAKEALDKEAEEAKEALDQDGLITTNNVAAAVVEAEREVVFPDNLLECRWSSRYLCPPKVHGLTEKIKFMERLMVKKTKEDGMFGAIAIRGIPGVGKTTLCQVMLKNEKVKKHYPIQLWVCLSKQEEDLDSRKVEILKRMLICLGHDDDVVDAIIEDTSDEGNIHKLIFAIRRQLKGRRYLVVLDDAAETDLDFLQNLSDPTPEPSEGGNVYKAMADVFPRDPGGMVVVTARLKKVAEKIVGEKNVHKLPLLESKGDCWEIFKDTVERDGKKYPEEHLDLEELITSKCAAVPLAAKMMGLIMFSQLKEREKRKQRKALEGQQQQAPIS